MRRAARIVVAMVIAAFAVPALACGFDKTHSTTTTMSTPAPAASTVAKGEKAKRVKAQKAEKAKAPVDQKVTASN